MMDRSDRQSVEVHSVHSDDLALIALASFNLLVESHFEKFLLHIFISTSVLELLLKMFPLLSKDDLLLHERW